MNTIVKCIFIFLTVSSQTVEGSITYGFSKGRLGDNLLSYAHAKWISYKYNIQLLYKPFKFSDSFALHTIEQRFISPARFKSKINITQKNCNSLTYNNRNLFIVPYYSEYPHEPLSELHGKSDALTVQWKDPLFKTMLQECIQPNRALEHIITPPENRISVALHLRKGGRADSPNAHLLDSLKFPPTSFFAEQLKFVCEKFNGQPLYVFVFTDDLNVEKIKVELLTGLQQYDIIMESRSVTSDTDFVLEDFFSLPNFNVLIRPCSNFSFVAGKLGNFLLEIAPRSFTRVGDTIHITEVDIYEA